MHDTNESDDDEKEAALLVKIKQEPGIVVEPSLRCGAFHVVRLFVYHLYSVQFVFGYCLCPSTLVEDVDNGFTANNLRLHQYHPHDLTRKCKSFTFFSLLFCAMCKPFPDVFFL